MSKNIDNNSSDANRAKNSMKKNNDENLLELDINYNCPAEEEPETVSMEVEAASANTNHNNHNNTDSSNNNEPSKKVPKIDDDEDETLESILEILPEDLKPLKDCMITAQGCCLLLILKQFLKEIYSINDA